MEWKGGKLERDIAYPLSWKLVNGKVYFNWWDFKGLFETKYDELIVLIGRVKEAGGWAWSEAPIEPLPGTIWGSRPSVVFAGGAVNGGTSGENSMIVTTKLKIRDAPNGKELSSFETGSKVFLVQSAKTSVENGYTWVKIYYDVQKTGWVAKNFLEEIPKSVLGHNFKYNWEFGNWHSGYWGTKTLQDKKDFMAKTSGIARGLQIEPDDLMAVMAFESWFSPSLGNAAGGSAVGLIQFMPTTANELNTTSADLARMSGLTQLDYVYGHLLNKGGKGKLKNLGDVYMSILWPTAIGKADSHTLWERGSAQYAANNGLDVNGDGKITRAEAVQKVIDRRNSYSLR